MDEPPATAADCEVNGSEAIAVMFDGTPGNDADSEEEAAEEIAVIEE